MTLCVFYMLTTWFFCVDAPILEMPITNDRQSTRICGLFWHPPSKNEFDLGTIVQQSGAVEACWAHNPEVRRSKLRSANLNFYREHTPYVHHKQFLIDSGMGLYATCSLGPHSFYQDSQTMLQPMLIQCKADVVCGHDF